MCDALNSTDAYQADFIDVNLIGESIPQSVCLPGNSSNHKFTNTHFTAERQGFVRGWVVELLSKYDVVNVHWASYLVSVSELMEIAARGTNVLFTMHDFYYSTGGCHYPAGCTGQRFSCRLCPQINQSQVGLDLITTAFRAKQKLLSQPNVRISAPSKFVVDQVIEAGLTSADRGHVIRNIYKPVDDFRGKKEASKYRLMLIADSLSEKRKGMLLAMDALQLANQRRPSKIETHVVGEASDEIRAEFKRRSITVTFHGRISNHHELVKIYQDCGILLTCSYEDNWPNILVEAGAYGVVPVVGSGHGCEEFCSNFGIGQIVTQYEPEEFAAAILELVDNFPSDDSLLNYCRKVRDQHDAISVVKSYGVATDVNIAIPKELATARIASGACVTSENYLDVSSRSRQGRMRIEPVKSGPFTQKSVEHSNYGIPQKVVDLGD